MQELLVIEDSTIAAMVRDDKFAGIPCLVNQASVITPTSTACGSCARKKLEAQRAALVQIKTCLAGLSPEKKSELKTLLNAKNIRVVFTTATGQVSTVTF